jgi:tyrosine-protein kinase Etk/Wzc
MTQHEANSAHARPDFEDGGGETSFLNVLVVLAKEKRLVLGLPTIAGAIALGVVFVMPHWYLATAKIMPPQQNQPSALAILGQLGGIAGGASQAIGLKNPSDTYVAMLKSRTIADKLIERFNLRAVYDEDLLFYARRELARNSNVTAGRDGMITIEVEDKNPQRAADLANAYVEELRALTGSLAVTEAGQRRVFFEAQLQKAKNDLTAAEMELKKFTQEAGLVNPQGQISVSVAAAASLRAQIAAKEIQVSAMRTFATENNPAIVVTLQELSSLRAELAKMEKNTSTKGDVMIPFGRAPDVGLEYVRRYRDTKYFETLFEVLAKQYEIARIDEAKDAVVIQVLDVAVPPERRSKPRRATVVVLATCVGFLLAIVIAFTRNYFYRVQSNPGLVRQLEELRKHVRMFKT